MKTILIAHNYTKKSVAAMSYHLAHHLAELGHKVIFISHRPYFDKPSTIETAKGSLKICSWSSTKRPTGLRDFFWFARLYIKYRPQVVIGHFVGSNISAIVSKLFSFGKTRTYLYYHTISSAIHTDKKKRTRRDAFLRFRKRIFYKWFCNVVVCPSEVGKKDLEDYYSVSKGRVVVNAISDRFNSEMELPENVIIISYLGRFDATKGVLDLILAFQRYVQRFPETRLRLRIAGSGVQKVEIEQQCAANSYLEFVGYLPYPEVDAYLQGSHFTIIPSKFDNLPTVGIEALMNKIPLLISNRTGLTQYLTEAKDCYKFEPELSDIMRVFDNAESNMDTYSVMSAAARETYLKTFSIANYCQTMTKLIE